MMSIKKVLIVLICIGLNIWVGTRIYNTATGKKTARPAPLPEVNAEASELQDWTVELLPTHGHTPLAERGKDDFPKLPYSSYMDSIDLKITTQVKNEMGKPHPFPGVESIEICKAETQESPSESIQILKGNKLLRMAIAKQKGGKPSREAASISSHQFTFHIPISPKDSTFFFR